MNIVEAHRISGRESKNKEETRERKKTRTVQSKADFLPAVPRQRRKGRLAKREQRSAGAGVAARKEARCSAACQSLCQCPSRPARQRVPQPPQPPRQRGPARAAPERHPRRHRAALPEHRGSQAAAIGGSALNQAAAIQGLRFVMQVGRWSTGRGVQKEKEKKKKNFSASRRRRPSTIPRAPTRQPSFAADSYPAAK